MAIRAIAFIISPPSNNVYSDLGAGLPEQELHRILRTDLVQYRKPAQASQTRDPEGLGTQEQSWNPDRNPGPHGCEIMG